MMACVKVFKGYWVSIRMIKSAIVYLILLFWLVVGSEYLEKLALKKCSIYFYTNVHVFKKEQAHACIAIVIV